MTTSKIGRWRYSSLRCITPLLPITSHTIWTTNCWLLTWERLRWAVLISIIPDNPPEVIDLPYHSLCARSRVYKKMWTDACILYWLRGSELPKFYLEWLFTSVLTFYCVYQPVQQRLEVGVAPQQVRSVSFNVPGRTSGNLSKYYVCWQVQSKRSSTYLASLSLFMSASMRFEQSRSSNTESNKWKKVLWISSMMKCKRMKVLWISSMMSSKRSHIFCPVKYSLSESSMSLVFDSTRDRCLIKENKVQMILWITILVK